MQSIEERLSRLRAMVADNQQTWDLSQKDTEAIQMAVDVLDLLSMVDMNFNGYLEMYDVDDDETPRLLGTGDAEEYYGETTLECFVKAGEAISKRVSSS